MRALLTVAVAALIVAGCDAPPTRLGSLLPDESPSQILRAETQWILGMDQPVSLTPDLPEIFFDSGPALPGDLGHVRFK